MIPIIESDDRKRLCLAITERLLGNLESIFKSEFEFLKRIADPNEVEELQGLDTFFLDDGNVLFLMENQKRGIIVQPNCKEDNYFYIYQPLNAWFLVRGDIEEIANLMFSVN